MPPDSYNTHDLRTFYNTLLTTITKFRFKIGIASIFQGFVSFSEEFDNKNTVL